MANNDVSGCELIRHTLVERAKPVFRNSGIHSATTQSAMLNDTLCFVAERPRSPDGGKRVSNSRMKLPPFRCIGLFAQLKPRDQEEMVRSVPTNDRRIDGVEVLRMKDVVDSKF